MFSSNTSFVPSPVGSKHNQGKIKYEWDNLNFEDEDDAIDYEGSIDDILAPLEPIEDSWTPPPSEVSPPYMSLSVTGLNIRCHSPVTVPAKKEIWSKSFQKQQIVKSSFPIVKKEPKQVISFLKHPPKGTMTKDGHFMKRRPRQIWSKGEDQRLLEILDTAIKSAKQQSDIKAEWSDVAKKMKTQRSAKQCRDRWQNYLRPGIQKGNWTAEEEQQIVDLYSKIGPKWSLMSSKLPHRSENDLKNKWYSMMRVKERSRSNAVKKPSGFLFEPIGVKQGKAFTGKESYRNQKPSSDETTARTVKKTHKCPGLVDSIYPEGYLEEDTIMPAKVESHPIIKDKKPVALGKVKKCGEIGLGSNLMQYDDGSVKHEKDNKLSATEVVSKDDVEDDFKPNFVPIRPIIL